MKQIAEDYYEHRGVFVYEDAEYAPRTYGRWKTVSGGHFAMPRAARTKAEIRKKIDIYLDSDVVPKGYL